MFNDNFANSNERIYLEGATLKPRHSQKNTSITVTITETQRVAFHDISAAKDGTPIKCVVGAGAFRDVSNNEMVQSSTITVTEVTDQKLPSILGASLNFSNGILIIEASETLDLDFSTPPSDPTTKYNLALVTLVNRSGDVPGVAFTGDHRNATNYAVDLTGSQIFHVDGVTATMKLPETKRVNVLRMSGVVGGDGSTAVMDVRPGGAFKDIAGNVVQQGYGFKLVEFPDVILPIVQSATIALGDGTLSLTFDEMVDGQVSLSDLGRAFFGFYRMDGETFELDDAKYWDDLRGIQLSSASIPLNATTPLSERDTTLSFRMDEVQRVRLVRLHQLAAPQTQFYLNLPFAFCTDLSLNPSLANPNITVVTQADAIRPKILSATINFSTGILKVESSEELDLSDPGRPSGALTVDLESFFLSDTPTGLTRRVNLTGSEYVATDNFIITLKLLENTRVAALGFSGVRGGDASAGIFHMSANAVTDVAFNGNLDTSSNDLFPHAGLVLTEYPDIVPPELIEVELDYGNGLILIKATETIDQASINTSLLYISNTPGDNFLPLGGANIVPRDGTFITFTLSEAARAGALVLSGVPGGDGGGVLVDIGYGAVMDKAQNKIASATNLPVAETPDLVIPSVKRLTASLGDGVFRVYCSETVKGDPDIVRGGILLGNMRYPFYDTLKINIGDTATMTSQAGYFEFPITSRIPTNSDLFPCASSICAAPSSEVSPSAQAHVRSFFKMESKGLAVTGGTALGLASLLKSYIFVKGNTLSFSGRENPMELRLTGLLPSTQYQITTYHHSNSGFGPDSDGMRISVIDGISAKAGLQQRDIVSGWQWSQVGGDVNLEDCRQVYVVETPSTEFVDTSFRGFSYQILVQMHMTGSGGDYHNIMPLNGLHVQLAPPPDPRGPSEVDPALDAPHAGLVGAQVIDPSKATYPAVEFQLTERQRVTLIENSGTPGGDGDALVADVASATFVDLAGNPVPQSWMLAVEETADEIPPSITGASINFGTGRIFFNVSEEMRVGEGPSFETEGWRNRRYIPSDILRLVFANTSEDILNCTEGNTPFDRTHFNINTSSSCFGATDASFVINSTLHFTTNMTVQLEESVRVQVLQMSNTPGGDGSSIFLGARVGFLQDLGQNPSSNITLATSNVFAALTDARLVEIPDTLPPVVKVAELDLRDGTLSLTFSETIDLIAYATNVSAIILSNATAADGDTRGGADSNVTHVQMRLSGALTKGSISPVKVQVQLSEAQRAWAVVHSGTAGGDGLEISLRLDDGAFFDLSGNGNEAKSVSVLERADDILPSIMRVHANYENGEIVLVLSESARIYPDARYSDALGHNMFNLSQMYLANASSLGNVDDDSGQGAALSPSAVAQRAVLMDKGAGTENADEFAHAFVTSLSVLPSAAKGSTFVSLRGSEIYNYTAGELEITLKLPETTRVLGIAMSGTPGGDALWENVYDYVRINVSRFINVTDNVTNITTRVEHIEEQDVPALNVSATAERERVARASSGAFLVVREGAIKDMAINSLAATSVRMVETADTSPPRLEAVTIDFGTKYMYISASETIDLSWTTDTDASTVDLAKLSIANISGDAWARLDDSNTYGTSTFDEIDTPELTLKLTERQKLRAAAASATQPYGDGHAAVFDVLAGALQDVAGNKILNATGVSALTIVELQDIIPPKILRATLNFSDGTLVVEGDESILSEPPSAVVSSLLAIVNTSDGSANNGAIVLTGANVVPVSAQSITLTIPEPARARGIAMSAAQPPAGDGGSSFLQFGSGSVQDVFAVSINQTIVPLVELVDIVPPHLTYVDFDFDGGYLRATFSETILARFVDPSAVFISNSSFAQDVPLGGSQVPLGPNGGAATVDMTRPYNQTIILRVSELTRVAALQLSSQRPDLRGGGDGSALVLDVVALDAFIDPALLSIPLTHGFPITEIPDARGPTVTSVVIHLGVGRIEFTLSETIDFTLHTDASGILIHDGAANASITGSQPVYSPSPLEFYLTRSRLVDTTNGTLATITLPELNRVNAIRMSATPGGDSNGPVMVSLAARVFTDLVNNSNIEARDIVTTEIADLVTPRALNATLIFSQVGNASTHDAAGAPVRGATEMSSPCAFTRCAFMRVRFSEILNTELDFPKRGDTTPENIRFGLAQRATTFNQFGVPSLNTLPLALEAGSVTGVDFTTLEFTLSEDLRVAALKLLQNGDLGCVLDTLLGAFRDVSLNSNVHLSNVPVLSVADLDRPELALATLNYSTGVLMLSFTETIDILGTANVSGGSFDFTQVVLQNISAPNLIDTSAQGLASWYGLEVPLTSNATRAVVIGGGQGGLGYSAVPAPVDTHEVSIQLQEEQRAAAIAISGVQGGDGSALVLDILSNAVAFRDVAGNALIPLVNVPIVEYPDVVLPKLQIININYMTGLMQFMSTETIDVTPSTYFDLSQVTIHDWCVSFVGYLSPPTHQF